MSQIQITKKNAFGKKSKKPEGKETKKTKTKIYIGIRKKMNQTKTKIR